MEELPQLMTRIFTLLSLSIHCSISEIKESRIQESESSSQYLGVRCQQQTVNCYREPFNSNFLISEFLNCPPDSHPTGGFPVSKFAIRNYFPMPYAPCLLQSRIYFVSCAWIAVMATVLTISVTVQPRLRSFTGLLSPCNTGPTATALAER